MLTIELAASLQKLIDARLDSIERALMSTDASRAERRQIVSAVKDQIFEMLGRLNRDDPSREDIIAVLGELDPPEAYVGSSANTRSENRGIEIRSLPRAATGSQPAHPSVLSVAAFTLACLSAAVAAMWWLFDIMGVFLVFLFAVPASVMGIVAICQIATSRHHFRGLWMAVVGTASPIISFIIAGLVYMLFVTMGM